MEEDALQDLRRSKLSAWLADNGGITAVAERCGLKPSGRSYLSQVTNGYSFGSRAARSWEKKLGIRSGWLDSPIERNQSKSEASASFTGEDTPEYRTNAGAGIPQDQALRQALEILGAALSSTMEDDVRDDLADALSKLAKRKGSQRDQDQVLHLLSSNQTGSKRAA